MQKLLDCTGLMMLTLRSQICLMSFFRRNVVANSARLFVDSNAGSPFVLKPNNTHKTRFISFVGAAHVFRVTSFINYAKVKNSVVRFNAVDVVNQSNRPITMYVQPSQPMRFVNFFLQAYGYIPNLVRVARNIANLNALGNALFPNKMTSSRVIYQKITKFICGHAGSPLLKTNINAGIIA